MHICVGLNCIYILFYGIKYNISIVNYCIEYYGLYMYKLLYTNIFICINNLDY